MAKSFAKIFKKSTETQYASGLMPLVAFGRLNKNIRFEKVGKAKDANGQFEYAVQRAQRVKAVDAPAATGKAGDDVVSLLNTSQKVTWVTIGTIRSAKRSLIIDIDPGEEIDMTGLKADFISVIGNRAKNRLLEAEEVALERLMLDAAGVRKVKGDVAGVDLSTDDAVAGGKMHVALKGTIRNVELLVDDFKAYSENIAILMHPVALDTLTDHAIESTGFSEGKSLIINGKDTKLMSTVTYKNKYPVFSHPMLNAIPELAADEKVLAVVLDMEAVGQADPSKTLTEIAPQKIGDKEFFGATYHELGANIDNARILVITGKLPANLIATAKVND